MVPVVVCGVQGSDSLKASKASSVLGSLHLTVNNDMVGLSGKPGYRFVLGITGLY